MEEAANARKSKFASAEGDARKSKFQSSNANHAPPPRRSAKQSAKHSDLGKKKSKKSGQKEEDGAPIVSAKPKPLDVSNGKALYKKYERCYYNSASLGKWVDACVIMVNESGEVMIDTKEEYWFTIEEQQEKFKAIGHKSYRVGESVQYNSVTQHAWLDCKVIVVDPVNHAIQVSVKENHWIKVPEQEEKVRYPVRPGIEELLWEAGRLLEKEPPDPDLAERKYRKVLEKEDDNVKAMEGLAILLRDYKKDFQGAEGIYIQALEESPYEMKALSDYADLIMFQGRREAAEDLYSRLAKVRAKLRDFDEEAEESEEEGV